MRLKSLELVGFKSFVDRTVINFEEGVTGIVGPNGCGKSNVVDAIRWVMGEQSAKHLRGSQMGDVIFNGTDSRPPMGMASVFLTFDNSDGRAPAEYVDYSEITVGRRLYRSGESEYYINKTSCRLRDIIDLFLGTGVGTKAYAIVEQGMIGQILSARPEDRRMLIEEAAGISKFKTRKEAALRKMEATRANMARLTDILGELQRQTGSLYRQAKKAERFREYTDELKCLDLAVSSYRYEELSKHLDGLKREMDNTKEVEVAGGSVLSREEVGIESARIGLNEMELDLDRLQEAIYEKQNGLQLTEAGITYCTKDIAGLKAQIERWSDEIADLEGKIRSWREELAQTNSSGVEADLKSISAEDDLRVLDQEIQRLRDDHHRLVVGLEEGRKRLFESIEKVSACSTHLDQIKRRETELEGWITKDQTEIDTLDEQISEVGDKAGRCSGDVSGTKQLRLKIESELSAAAETLIMQRKELATAEAEVAGIKEALGNKQSRLNSLEELQRNYEGYQDGVRAVLRRREENADFEGVFGTINDVIETEPRYESAVGAVLGEKLQYVVVESHEVGVEAIDYLKAQATGRSTFVPIGLRASENTEKINEGEGVIGHLADYVRYADDYRKVVDYLLGDVVLVEDLEKALNLWDKNGTRCTMVTLGGEVVDPAGAVTGGAGGDVSEQLIAHRREIKELTETVSAMARELNLKEQVFTRLRDRVSGLERNVEDLTQESRHEELKLVNQEKDLHHLEQELRHLNAQRDKLTIEIAAFAEEQASVKREIESSEISYEAESRKKAGLEKDVTSAQEREDAIRRELQSMMEKRAELNLSVRTGREGIERLGRDINRLITSLAEGCTGIASRRFDISAATQTIKTEEYSVECKRRYLGALIESIDRLRSEHTEIKGRYDVDIAALREKEAGIRELRKVHDGQMKKMHEVELEFTAKREKLNYLCREIFDRYRIDLANSYQEYLTEDIDLEVSSERVDELKERIDRIGSVNVDAIKEYEELRVRHDFLKKQYDDLEASLEDLQKAILKINKTSRVRFQEAFESVDERFQKLFPKLFDGGKARLVLIDEQNVLESGVDIVAQPPGKKLQSITLLSGGEKALTAVALVFALFLHHPSPFCLLDEVDAPLDDANIDRFNDLIREMTKLSQFILITHNKRTMELADTLYGVTMEERGASKIVSLSLTDRKADARAA